MGISGKIFTIWKGKIKGSVDMVREAVYEDLKEILELYLPVSV